MMRHVLAAAGLALLALCAFLPSAAATMQGPCDGTVAGMDVDRLSASDADEAIPVGPDDQVSYTFSADSAVTRFDTQARYGPYTATVDQQNPDSNQTTADGTLDVSRFSGFGVGLYAVEAHATLDDGSTCTAKFLLRVDGSILSSSVGKAAVGLVVLAGAGLVVTSFLAASGAKTVLASLKAAL